MRYLFHCDSSKMLGFHFVICSLSLRIVIKIVINLILCKSYSLFVLPERLRLFELLADPDLDLDLLPEPERDLLPLRDLFIQH